MERPTVPDEPRTLEAPAAGSETPAAAGSAEAGRPVAGRIRNLLSQSGPLLGLLVLGFVLTLMSDRFLTFTNLTNVGQQIAVIAIVALGSTFVIISVSYTHLRAHETRHDLVCRLL